MLVKHLPAFAGHEFFVEWQIGSERSESMAKKSKVVSQLKTMNSYLLSLQVPLGVYSCTMKIY